MPLAWWKEKQLKDLEEGTIEERRLLLPGKSKSIRIEPSVRVGDTIYSLFTERHRDDPELKTHPQWSPEKRGRRHRDRSIYDLNQFRHWWKTSRLLVRLAGSLMYIENDINWNLMGFWQVADKQKHAKQALKMVKDIGRGGPVRTFLSQVKPFTRTVRLILAIARALEARVDNRMLEVGFAEAFAFMGNRCFRHFARFISDWTTKTVAFPFSAFTLQYFDFAGRSRAFIVLMGFIRAILPFASSFQGSRFGRQVTFSTFREANFRWRPVQGVSMFHEGQGVYQDTDPDPDLLALVRNVAEAIGHGADPTETRRKLTSVGFKIVGTGTGGYAVYVISSEDVRYVLHLTPYGPSIIGEMPRFVYLERKAFADEPDGIPVDPVVLGAVPSEAVIEGFTYSGSYFKPQEWAALKIRFERELHAYGTACRISGTFQLPKQGPGTNYAAPPKDLVSLKSFIRSGNEPHKQKRDQRNYIRINRVVNQISRVIDKYKKQNKAPRQVILYFEGLDCAGKSSTGNLISNALNQCGYSVTTAQHNRPPTPEQSAKPWMDRGRFEHPEDMYQPREVPEYSCVIWDRGPAGDFVYNPSMVKMAPGQKMDYHRQFEQYDQDCAAKGILFLKLFFVSDRDSIAKTLGKRLAHKHIAQDLKTWLDANSIPRFREGIAEIENHVDPTDFVAFNKYEVNLARFTEFVRNTDAAENPWVVVNTSDRPPARSGVLKMFRRRLDKFAEASSKLSPSNLRWSAADIHSDLIIERPYGIPLRAILQSLILLILAYAYAQQTWKIDILQVVYD